ncbi:conjugal transfer protein [Salmonella enterica]|uniref:VirB4 family type IV secretion system protein n=1 Tax=Klebsiella pneumoniae TaxID=573 RepID=UPI001033CA39|nr:VirB4 family type IV secretion system protein [Klebsiella pneumoniae]EBJ5156713.1 conjugal transfer protein [Salmonella enterica]EET1434522.1 conjugal transfer protein [Escherichia coli]EBM6019333.1 conjugal transfer protein [Salmonella enterica]EFM5365723.1 conjugal transfer protein [Escherichia coli]EGH5609879.1 conjugal transfer protein [Escherichia coli]
MLKNALKKTLPFDKLAPQINFHIAPEIVTMNKDRIMAMVVLRGCPYETEGISRLNINADTLNDYFINLGKKEGSNLAIHTYQGRHKVLKEFEYSFDNEIVQGFADAYLNQFKTGEKMESAYAFCLVLKYSDLEFAESRMKEYLELARNMLAPFQPKVLGVREENGMYYSEICEQLFFYFNGYRKKCILTDSTRISDAMIDSVTSFGNYDFIEIHPNKGGKRYAVTYDLRDFPIKPRVGMFDDAMEQNIEFIFVQTFHYLRRNEMTERLSKHYNNLSGSQGETDETKKLETAAGKVSDGTLQFGLYTASLIVYGDSQAQAFDRGTTMESKFGMAGFVRSTVTNIYTYLSLVPGYNDLHYQSEKTTENLVAGFSLHGMPAGKEKLNPLGDGMALMPLPTDKGGVYFSNTTNSEEGQDVRGQPYAAHFLLLGQSEAGKTTLLASIANFYSRHNPYWFGIDFNRSMENFLRNLNVSYYVIQAGYSPGWNPFQLNKDNALIQFLNQVVISCVGGKANTSEQEQLEIKEAIEAVLDHEPVEERGLSLLYSIIPPRGEGDLRSRLKKWCRETESGPGIYSWVIDAEINTFNPETTVSNSGRGLAFDTTEILNDSYRENNPEVTETILNTLFFYKKLMHRKGGLLINLVEEFWVPLSYDTTANHIGDVLRAGRMRLEIMGMSSQNPEHALRSKIGKDVFQQVGTKYYLPNNNADWEDYKKTGMERPVFDALRKLGRTSRKFIFSQGETNVICDFSLKGDAKYYLPMLSTTKRNAMEAEELRKELGTDDPAIWMPEFLKRQNNKY